jgi:hypothetical protein
MTILQLVSHLAELTEQQFDLAVRLQGVSLAAINTQRQDLLFELQIALEDGLPEDASELEALALQVRRLRRAEQRLECAAGLVVAALEPTRQRQQASTYNRSGSVGIR